MKIYVWLYLILFAPLAHACPDLRGVYRCSQGAEDLIFLFEQQVTNGISTYTMDALFGGHTHTQVVIADGVVRERSGEFGQIRQSAVCANDVLQTRYESISSTGWGRSQIFMFFELTPTGDLKLRILDENIQGPDHQTSERTEICRRS